uniref:NrS-1 polymerase-like HBD domain-containing protein n=1 Tax=Candidatus Kentrum sp. FM TaxID=2126340 RepID=A0A450VLC7_9GAMM|nr:MAG: hypothetical protein BECKFM1743A_GA0114220_1000122 [Candidatus Kentron sp. FM]VFJ43372.1 MAG: hypothetical protein BECKFM1743C_GA0114222_1000122 [Candidatus Kentron sp. FM]VFK05517.1 MAG: hypothetical protein BECKFM1743B_GA0114221_1000122 [Candidatus Kentron sp. FM]
MNVPEELKHCSQWVIWRYGTVRGNGKPTKEPVNPATGRRARINQPTQWNTFPQAVDAVNRYRATGVGFVFSEHDPYCGIDLDSCRNPETEAINPWALGIIQRLNSFTEVSPSGTGVHVIVKGMLPVGGNRRGSVEMYDRNRYFTVTGQPLKGMPLTVEERQEALEALHRQWIQQEFREKKASNSTTSQQSGEKTLANPDQELIRRAMAAANGDKFRRLWNADVMGHASESEATLALLNLLAFWTGKDAARMDRLFRASDLMRNKWDEKRASTTWGLQQIQKAIANTTTVYDGHREFHGKTCNVSATGMEWPDPEPLSNQLEKPSPYPLEVLPECLRRCAEEVARFAKVPAVSPAVVGLSVAALTISKKACIQERQGLTPGPIPRTHCPQRGAKDPGLQNDDRPSGRLERSADGVLQGGTGASQSR